MLSFAASPRWVLDDVAFAGFRKDFSRRIRGFRCGNDENGFFCYNADSITDERHGMEAKSSTGFSFLPKENKKFGAVVVVKDNVS